MIINANTTKVSDSFSDIYTMSYQSIKKFQDSIENKLDELQSFIEEKKKCIAEEEQKIEECSTSFSQKSAIFSTNVGRLLKNFSSEYFSCSMNSRLNSLNRVR